MNFDLTKDEWKILDAALDTFITFVFIENSVGDPSSHYEFQDYEVYELQRKIAAIRVLL